MYIIKHYKVGTQGEDAPKGSASNPYSQEEFFQLLEEGKWQGGYVVGLGYCEKETFVYGSFPYSSFHFSFDDSWWSSVFPWSSWGFGDGGGDSCSGSGCSGGGTGGGSGNGSGHKGNGGSGGGNQGYNPDNIYSPWATSVLGLASEFSPTVKEMLQRLMAKGKIRETYDIKILAQWDSENETMTIGPYAKTEHILHELTHSLQAESSHSNKEWQAYMLDDLYDLVDGAGFQHAEGLDSATYDKYRMEILDYSGYLKGGVPYVKYKLIEYLNGLDYKRLIEKFMEYWKKQGFTNYVDGYDEYYYWNWEAILRGMGFKVVYE